MLRPDGFSLQRIRLPIGRRQRAVLGQVKRYITTPWPVTDFLPRQLTRNVHRLVTFLRDRSIAHNLFLTRGRPFVQEANPVDDWNTLRVFVWARQSTFGECPAARCLQDRLNDILTGVKEEIGFNPAMCELAGHLLIKGKRLSCSTLSPC